MDTKSYYQAGDNVFRGSPYQRGYGLGGAFRRFFSWALPILKQNLTPAISNIGKELVQGVSNVTTDAISGKDVESSAKENFRKAVKNLGGHVGSGYKRKRKSKNFSHKKRKLDIFD